MRRWLYALLLFLLAAPTVQAQNSFNQWTAAPPAPITPRARKVRPVVKPAPAPVAAPVSAPPTAAAPVVKPPAEEPVVKQSKLIKRGLTTRMREHRPLAEDSISVVFFNQNSRYPDAALRAGAQGNVVIKLQVAPSGEVSQTSVVALQPRVVAGRKEIVPVTAMQALADEAQRIFRMLRFEPAARSSVEELTASFSLN